MRYTDHAVLVPSINQETCIECGLCQKVCPVITPNIKPNQVIKCYAAWSTDRRLLENAASAGVVTTLGYHTIQNGGMVFGARFDDKRLVITGASTLKELLEFQGSRYVHAFVGQSFIEIKRYLDSGRRVMFTGTPCQVHGLRQYLQKDYSNLLTVDLVCHGVAPMSYLNEYLSEKGIDDYDNVVFRGKHGMSLVVSKDENILYRKYKFVDLFYMAYLKGLLSRENCYQCPYSSPKRYGDVTVGDFWGLERTSDMPNHPFISVLFTNTAKGEQWINELRDSIQCVEKPLEMALKKNGQLNRPCTRHRGRDRFLALYPDRGLVKSIKKSPFYRDYLKRAWRYRALLFASNLKHFITHGTSV